MSESGLGIVGIASGSAADIYAATDAAIDTARAGMAKVKSGDGSPVEVLDAYDESCAALANARNLCEVIGCTNPDKSVRDAANECRRRMAAVATEFQLDAESYAVLASLDLSDQDAPTRYYLEKTLRDFRRAGVDRDEATRARITELRDAIAAAGTSFAANIREDTRTGRFTPSALDGLPEDYRRAHPAGDDGLVAITTQYPDVFPFLAYSTDAAAREEMWRLMRLRAYPANATVLRELITLRAELASVLGYESWAHYITEDKMIGSDKAAAEFIERISDAAKTRSAADYTALLERKRVDEPDAEQVLPWDSAFLSDRLKAEKLAFDTRAVRPYFEYTRVKTGLMAQVERMFGIQFRPVTDAPVWHPEVEVHDVFRAGGDARLGRIYLDMHPRADKFGHASFFSLQGGKAGFNIRGGKASKGRLPVGALVCNLPRPGDEPALLLHSDVTTFFHEFGHLIHFILGGHQRWAGSCGIGTEQDFVEAPSQLLEEWTFDPATLARFATHHETGEPLPAQYMAKLRAADEFGKGLQVAQQMYLAALSLELHRRDPATIDIDAVNQETMEAHTPFGYVPGTYMPYSFLHLLGLSALYYGYSWSQVIAKDLFTRFATEGLPAPEVCAAYRDAVLGPGGSAPAAELVERFLGRPHTIDAYQQWLDAG